MTCPTVQRIAEAQRGENPAVIRQMPSGWAMLFNWQKLPGYTILMADPIVASLNDLAQPARQQFLTDMAAIGDALLSVTDAVRINYQILCNVDPVLHAHICPRYAWEESTLLRSSAASYDQSAGPFFEPERDGELMKKLNDALLDPQKH